MKKHKKKITLSWSSLFINKAFDLVIVIAGVSIAFQLGSLKQNIDDKSLERFYLESMLSDLDKDIDEYEDNLKELTSDRQKVHSCLMRMEKKEDVTDSLGFVVVNILSLKTFEGHRNAYTTIMNSNGLRLIRDPGIRNMILEHYRLYAAIERFEENYEVLIARALDYFSSYIDYNNVEKVSDRSILKQIQTKNLLTIVTAQLQGGIWRYEESLEKAKTLKESIALYLEQ